MTARTRTVAYGLTLATAVGWFWYGMAVPIEYRVRGDATHYMLQALRASSPLDAWLMVGDRPNGMALLDYLFKHPDLRQWALSVSVFLLIVHLATSGWFARVVSIQMSFARSVSEWLLFTGLAAYPPLVLHTTTPLTDTLAADVAMAIVCLLSEPRWRRAAMAGVLVGFAITLRPAYLAGTAALLAAQMTWPSGRWRESALGAVALLCAALYVTPTVANVHARWGTWGFQDPATLPLVPHAQAGLSGVRMLWFSPERAHNEALPELPDPWLDGRFFERCRLESVIGVSNNSLSGCLLTRPDWLAGFIGKKWLAFHDTFRLQPYTEQMTPQWYPVVARTMAGVIAWGQLLLFVGVGYRVRRRGWDGLTRWEAATVAFALGQTLLHLLLHVDERFSLSWAPFSIAAVVLAIDAWPRLAIAVRRAILGSAALVVALYWVQVLAWDRLAR